MQDGRVHRMTELFARLAPGVELDAARAELRTVHAAMVKAHPESYPKNGDFRIEAVRLRDQITSSARTVLLVLLAASGAGVHHRVLERRQPDPGALGAPRRGAGDPRGARRQPRGRCGGRCSPRACCSAAPARSSACCIARPMVAILARYAARFSVRALDLTVDSSLLWVGVGARDRRGGSARVRAAAALVGRARAASACASGGVRITSGTNRRLRAVRRDADRRVVRAAGRRRHAADDAVRAAAGADRLPRRTTCSRSTCRWCPTSAARRARAALQGRHPRHLASCRASSASRSARSCRGATPARSVRASSSRSRATRRSNGEEDPRARFRTVSPGFFAALGVPIIAGRDFTDADRHGAEPVVIISQSVAQRMFPNQDAREPPPDVDRSGDEVHRRQHRRRGGSSASRPTSTTRTSCRARR